MKDFAVFCMLGAEVKFLWRGAKGPASCYSTGDERWDDISKSWVSGSCDSYNYNVGDRG